MAILRLKESHAEHYVLIERAHKEVLYFASPFFQAALSGHWAETSSGSSNRPQSMSSVVTISQSPSAMPGEAPHPEGPTEMTFARMENEPGDGEASASESEFSDVGGSNDRDVEARKKSLDRLRNSASPTTERKSVELDKAGRRKLVPLDTDVAKPKEQRAQAKVKRKPHTNGPDAVIVLKEEKVPFCALYLRMKFRGIL